MTEEIRTTSSTGGQKGVKRARFDLIPVGALTALAEHYGVGAEKYDDNQWRKGYEWSKSYAALQRHVTAWWAGEDIDEETGSSHIAAVAWHAFTLLTFIAEHPEHDDRFRPVERPSAAGWTVRVAPPGTPPPIRLGVPASLAGEGRWGEAFPVAPRSLPQREDAIITFPTRDQTGREIAQRWPDRRWRFVGTRTSYNDTQLLEHIGDREWKEIG